MISCLMSQKISQSGANFAGDFQDGIVTVAVVLVIVYAN